MNRLGQYELLRVRGEGGHGRVYEAILHGRVGWSRPIARWSRPSRSIGTPETSRPRRRRSWISRGSELAWALGDHDAARVALARAELARDRLKANPEARLSREVARVARAAS